MPPKPIELTDIQRQEIETLAALLNQEQIADYLGIGRTTFHRLMQRDPDVAERYKRGKARAIAHVARGLLMKARAGDTVSSIFYLKTQAGWRETERLEHSGPDGSAIMVDRATMEADAKRFLDDIARLRTRMGPPLVEATSTAPQPAGDPADDAADGDAE
jgi:predicted RNA binding protein with dsRBD fold (UPF0201 family)